MTIDSPSVFKGRHFQAEIIVLCLRWYWRESLSDRDLEEMLAERGDHSTRARGLGRRAGTGKAGQAAVEADP